MKTIKRAVIPRRKFTYVTWLQTHSKWTRKLANKYSFASVVSTAVQVSITEASRHLVVDYFSTPAHHQVFYSLNKASMPAGKKKIQSSNPRSVLVYFDIMVCLSCSISFVGVFDSCQRSSQLCILPAIVWSGLSTSISPLLNLAHVSYLSASCVLSSPHTFSGNSHFFLKQLSFLKWAELVKRSPLHRCYLPKLVFLRWLQMFISEPYLTL